MSKTKRNILGIDVGSGQIKVALDINGTFEITEEVTGVAKIEISNSSIIPDDADYVVSLDGETKYVVGENSLHYPSKDHIRTDTFENIKAITPLIIKKYLNKCKSEGKDIDLIVTGISLAYVDGVKDKEFKEYICETLELPEEKVAIIPQGVGAKFCFSKYGLKILGNSKQLIKSYLGVDIGYNTTDYIHVVDGNLSGTNILGEEQTGLVVLVRKIKDEIIRYLTNDIGVSDTVSISEAEAKNVLKEKQVIYAGVSYDMSEFIESAVVEYLQNMSTVIKDKFKADLTTFDRIVIFGGGGMMLKNYMHAIEEIFQKDFIIIPDKSHYYNAVGFTLAGRQLLSSIEE